MKNMGKRLLCTALCLCLALGCLAACGKKEETDQELTGIFSDLLAADYEVYYLFYSDGLPVDQAVTETVGEGEYHPVTSAQYKDLGALKKLLEGVYAKKDQVEAILAVEDPNGHPLLAEVDGKLYRSATRDIFALGYELEEGSLAIKARSEGAATFSFQETGLDGSLYETSMSMTKTGAGWRLDGTRAGAKREMIREGSGESSLVGEGEARRVAEAFLAALRAGDAEALSGLTMGGDWTGVRASRAEISEVREELDSQGDYIVSLTVTQGGSVLQAGDAEYRLRVGFYPFSDQVGPTYFRPAQEEYYNLLDLAQRDSVPANQVEEFIGMYGAVTFSAPEELPADTITEYAMLLMASQSGEWDRVFTLEEVASQVESSFGIGDFDAKDTKFYSAEMGGCIIWGRGGTSYNMLIEMPVVREGRAVVTVGFFEDILCTVSDKVLTYTLEENPDGSWRFVSVKRL